MTGLRFIAAFLVFVYHGTVLSVFADTTVQSGYSSVAANAGAIGVSFFFVRSGFALTWSARPGDRPQRFWRQRAVKVFPNHVVAYVIALVLLLAAGESIRVGPAVATLFLVHTASTALFRSAEASDRAQPQRCGTGTVMPDSVTEIPGYFWPATGEQM